jgi:hypothetical protein
MTLDLMPNQHLHMRIVLLVLDHTVMNSPSSLLGICRYKELLLSALQMDWQQTAPFLLHVKLPRGLEVRLEHLLRWRLFGERRKMLPAELR